MDVIDDTQTRHAGMTKPQFTGHVQGLWEKAMDKLLEYHALEQKKKDRQLEKKKEVMEALRAKKPIDLTNKVKQLQRVNVRRGTLELSLKQLKDGQVPFGLPKLALPQENPLLDTEKPTSVAPLHGTHDPQKTFRQNKEALHLAHLATQLALDMEFVAVQRQYLRQHTSK